MFKGGPKQDKVADKIHRGVESSASETPNSHQRRWLQGGNKTAEALQRRETNEGKEMAPFGKTSKGEVHTVETVGQIQGYRKDWGTLWNAWS